MCIKMKSSSRRSFKCSRINLRHISLVGQELLKGNCGGFYTPAYTLPCQPHSEAVIAFSSGARCLCWHCLIALCRVLSWEQSPAASLLAQQHQLRTRAQHICLPLCTLDLGVSVFHANIIQHELTAALRSLQSCQMRCPLLQLLQLLGEGKPWAWRRNHFFHTTDASKHPCNTV